MARRIGAAALLVGFLAHSGDGLMAALCSPEMDHGPVELTAHGPGAASDDVPGEPGSSHEDHGTDSVPAHEDGPASHDGPCPFGPAAPVVCGGGATVPSLGAPSVPDVSPESASVLSEPTDSRGTLLAMTPFRPPRA